MRSERPGNPAHSKGITNASPGILGRWSWIALLGIALVTVALTVAIAVLAQQPAIPPGATGFVYTANERGNSVSAIDLSTGQVVTVETAFSLHNVQVTADGTRLLAVGAEATEAMPGMPGMAGMAEGQLLVFDTAALTLGPIAAVPVGDHPAHVVVDRAGRLAFVTLSEEDAVAVVDLSLNEVVGNIDAGPYPHGIRLSPDGRFALVANVENDSVSVLDTSTLAEVARIPVGDAPVQVAFTPDGELAYVSLRDENAVAVIDIAARTVVDRIPVGQGPIQVHVTPDGRYVYVANQGSETVPGDHVHPPAAIEPSDTVSVIEVATGRVVETIRTGAGPHGVAVSSDGRFVFVTNIVAGTLSMIATDTRSVVATFDVGDGPNGVTFRPGT